MHYTFVEIGTSDFDTMLQTCTPEDRGLSVDPIQFYLDRLPNLPNVTKVLAAVSDKDGTASVFFVPLDAIEKHGLPDWVRGSNAINDYPPPWY